MQSVYIETREDLIRRGILSPAARDMAFGDITHQLEQYDPSNARALRDAWVQAGGPYETRDAYLVARREAGITCKAHCPLLLDGEPATCTLDVEHEGDHEEHHEGGVTAFPDQPECWVD